MEFLLWLSCNILSSMAVALAVVAPGLLHKWWNCKCWLVIIQPTTTNGLESYVTSSPVLPQQRAGRQRMYHCLCIGPWWHPERLSSEIERCPKGYSMSPLQWRWQPCGLSCRRMADLKNKICGCSVRTDEHTVIVYTDQQVGVCSTPGTKDYRGTVVSLWSMQTLMQTLV